ncbi:MAG: acetate/propionate family kinase [Thermoanaerobaculia bacterium]
MLVFNAGSSSLKYGLFDGSGALLTEGNVKRIGSAECVDHGAAVERVLRDLQARPDGVSAVRAAGHRVVHGGPELWQPTLVDEAVLATLARHAELAPLHNGPSLTVMRAARSLLADVPHVAVFDTGFHHELPAVAQAYALPRELTERFAIRRYGFHGISCAYLMRRIGELGIAPSSRTLLCHLGSGASVTAVLEGRSVDTSMGFTPLEGLMMGTRSGDLDAGLVLFLQRHAGLDPDGLEQVLEKESGLRGVSGTTGDLAELERLAATGDARAAAAIELFCYRVRKYLGAFWAVLGGVDLIVFSGGIGENSAFARERILGPMNGLGWSLDETANAGGADFADARRISTEGSSPAIWVIPTDEAVQIARHVRELV